MPENQVEKHNSFIAPGNRAEKRTCNKGAFKVEKEFSFESGCKEVVRAMH